VGELVQFDGPEHAWFEAPGPVCSLLAFIDDALSHPARIQPQSGVARNMGVTVYLTVAVLLNSGR